jgi:hypothetical protein
VGTARRMFAHQGFDFIGERPQGFDGLIWPELGCCNASQDWSELGTKPELSR